MNRTVNSTGRRARTLAILVAAAVSCGAVTACGPDARTTSATSTRVVTTTGVATTATPTSQSGPELLVGSSHQLAGTENGGYAATVTVTRIWRSSATRISADVVFDVAHGTVPASKRWTIVDHRQRTHIGSSDDDPITGHFEDTVTFSTPTNTSPRHIRFGDADGGVASTAMWTVPALSRFVPRTTKRTTTTRAAKTTTKTRTKTTRTKRTTTR